MTKNVSYGELLDSDFKRLSKFIYDNYGINLYPQKKVLVKSRLIKRLAKLNFNNYTDYCDFVLKSEQGKKEAVHMINIISTNKTDFFRESDHFDYLTNTIINEYVNQSGRKKLRLWSAGCSSGEEPYTLAMVLYEAKQHIPFFDFKIYASDISTTVLEKASKAIYDTGTLEQIPAIYHSKYLLKSKDKSKEQIRIASNIRNKVTFFRYNILSNKNPFKYPINIIFCSNTLIYFDLKTQANVINKLMDYIRPGGYLFLGHSESLINTDFSLRSVFPAVYQKE